MKENKTLEEVRLELGEYFNHGAIFYDWEKEAGIFNTSITRTEEEEIAFYKEVENVIKAVLKTGAQDRVDLLNNKLEEAKGNSYVRGEEFSKILNSLPLDEIIMISKR